MIVIFSYLWFCGKKLQFLHKTVQISLCWTLSVVRLYLCAANMFPWVMSEWPAVSHRYLQCFMCFVRTHYMPVGVCLCAVALQLDGFNEAGCPHNEYTGVAEGSSYWKPLEFIRCELVSSPVLIRRNLLYTHTHTLPLKSYFHLSWTCYYFWLCSWVLMVI